MSPKSIEGFPSSGEKEPITEKKEEKEQLEKEPVSWELIDVLRKTKPMVESLGKHEISEIFLSEGDETLRKELKTKKLYWKIYPKLSDAYKDGRNKIEERYKKFVEITDEKKIDIKDTTEKNEEILKNKLENLKKELENCEKEKNIDKFKDKYENGEELVNLLNGLKRLEYTTAKGEKEDHYFGLIGAHAEGKAAIQERPYAEELEGLEKCPYCLFSALSPEDDTCPNCGVGLKGTEEKEMEQKREK